MVASVLQESIGLHKARQLYCPFLALTGACQNIVGSAAGSFEIIFETPALAPVTQQAEAACRAVLSVLAEYRGFIAHGVKSEFKHRQLNST